MPERADLVVIGAGAAGLMAAVQAGRTVRRAGTRLRIVALDGARRLGAKILVAGGGRCNVTHERVDETAFAGSSRAAIRKVLRRFDVPATVAFFGELGVELKREPSGKLFPVTDRARTVLDALLDAAEEAGVELLHPRRVEILEPATEGFLASGSWGRIASRRVILAAGGRSLPKSGSDGHGYALARSLGHSTTERILPALVPLTLEEGCFVRFLPGVAVEVRLEVRSGAGRRLAAVTGAMLCTHFGISGPAVLDISRHYLHARADDPGALLAVCWLPGETQESLDQALRELGGSTPGAWLRRRLPDRLALALCAEAGADPTLPGHRLTRQARRALAAAVLAMRLPVTGDRGFTHAEVTAGGVPLRELHLETMESRIRPGLHLCGEILDVDGRIGGFNFQWAWASGFVAGGAAAALLRSAATP